LRAVTDEANELTTSKIRKAADRISRLAAACRTPCPHDRESRDGV
jgi:hypothetical protein